MRQTLVTMARSNHFMQEKNDKQYQVLIKTRPTQELAVQRKYDIKNELVHQNPAIRPNGMLYKMLYEKQKKAKS